jgi:5-methylcytosine-specific restriction endonuclease McrA
MSSTRIRKNLLGSTPPQSVSMFIRSLFAPDYFEKINIRPRYQRHIRWKLPAMCELISLIMNNGLLNNITIYKLHPEDKVEHQGKYDDEVMDGQHRLFTLNAFKSSSLQKLPHIKKPFIVHECYETIDENGNKNIQRLFYKDSPELQNWYRDSSYDGVPCFYTQEEKNKFDSFVINITMIYSKLSFNDRRENFISFQKGIPVRNSDYLKNICSCKLIAEFDANGYEEMMNVFLSYCTKKATRYWVQWATRCFLLFKRNNTLEERSESEPVDIFLKKDTAIKIAIEKNHVELNPSGEEFDKFDDVFRCFIAFLQNLDEVMEFNPTQLFALANHFFCGDVDTNVMRTHMPLFAKNGKKKAHKTLWEHSNSDQRKDYFNDCLAELSDMTEEAIAIPLDTKKPSKALKKQVFEKAKVCGACDTCGTKITIDKFHCGHILARKLNGLVKLDNLIPLCAECNLSMGTLDPDYYKKQVLPYNKL